MATEEKHADHEEGYDCGLDESCLDQDGEVKASVVDWTPVVEALHLLRRLHGTDDHEGGASAPWCYFDPEDMQRKDCPICKGIELDDWTPTPENINALPRPLRKYLHDLETNADPAGMVAENAMLRTTVEQLQSVVTRYQDTIGRLKVDRDKYKEHNAVAQGVAKTERAEKKALNKKLDAGHRVRIELMEQLQEKNVPAKHYREGGIVYAVYGTSSISYVTVLRKKIDDALEQIHDLEEGMTATGLGLTKDLAKARKEIERLRAQVQRLIDAYIARLDPRVDVVKRIAAERKAGRIL